ncbi:hypothetical protein [Vibrio mexicanus]|uniref:hypothetical protein n=1 Tax=Vibrio mexicanus TaxID=1004326 RepID=UPI00063CCF98|nr:hypothetical protein [Vibrio mexicanus]
MAIKDSIEALEQQIYIASSEGDYDTVYMLEHQLESLRYKVDHPFEEDQNDLPATSKTEP